MIFITSKFIVTKTTFRQKIVSAPLRSALIADACYCVILKIEVWERVVSMHGAAAAAAAAWHHGSHLWTRHKTTSKEYILQAIRVEGAD